MPKCNKDAWLQISQKFYEKTNFPNCIGALDGKHIRVKKPNNTGSEYYNYKCFFSVVLMAMTDADYKFTAIDVGSFGSSSDSNVFKRSKMYKLLNENKFDLPEPSPLPDELEKKPMPYVFVGDEAFAVSKFVLRPYPNKNLSVKKRIFNYRLCRARRMVECTFGILANKWRIFHRPLDVNEDFCISIIKACCLLHNITRTHEGVEFEDELYKSNLNSVPVVGTRGSSDGVSIRDFFADYFISPQGAIAWQYNKI